MRGLALTFALTVLAAQSALGQTPTGANLVGAAFDSVRGVPLAGARIFVDTTGIMVTADESGLYHIEGIPPGSHYLRAEHPILDTLTISLRSAPIALAAGETKLVQLATPAAERLLPQLCSAAWRQRGPAALVGRVREADTGKPATGAKVSLVWYEVAIISGVRRVPVVREVRVGADGSYRLCGLSPQFEGQVQVLRGNLTSGEIAVNAGQDLLVMRNMSIAAPGAVVAVRPDSGAETSRSSTLFLGSARLTGRVTNKAGQPIVGARVQLEGTPRSTTTRSNGEFTLDSLPSGTQSVAVRLIGYTPAEAAVELSAARPATVAITMADFVPVLSEVRTTATRQRALDQEGFSRRKRSTGGTFMEADDIAKKSVTNVTDVLRAAPGLRISRSGPMNGQLIEDARNPGDYSCVNIWIDRSPWQQGQGGELDRYLRPDELAAIEVYSGSQAPAEFQQLGKTSCATIVLWTKSRMDRPDR